MNASLLAVLNDAERLLVAQTEPAELAALDEDAAIELEARIGVPVPAGQYPCGGGPSAGEAGQPLSGSLVLPLLRTTATAGNGTHVPPVRPG
jgi:hypothetical protein